LAYRLTIMMIAMGIIIVAIIGMIASNMVVISGGTMMVIVFGIIRR